MRIGNIIITTVKKQRKEAKQIGKVILDKDEQIGCFAPRCGR